MSKKHYQKIAAILRFAWLMQANGENAYACMDHVSAELADLFQRDNDRFDRERFELATDPESKA